MFEIVFQMFDLNGDGEVSLAEFEKVIKAIIIATAVWLVDKLLNGSEAEGDQGPVSQKSWNFSGLFQFPLYLHNAEVLRHQTLQPSWFFLDKKTC